MAVIQSVGADNGTGNTSGAGGLSQLQFTLASTAAGSLVGVAFRCTGTVSSITDNLGNSYTRTAGSYEIYFKPSSASGVTTITVLCTASTEITGFAYEIGNIATSASEDADASNFVDNGAGGTWSCGPSASTSQANTLGIIFCDDRSNTIASWGVDSPAVVASGTGITAGVRNNATNGNAAALGFITYGSAGAKTVTGTSSSTKIRAGLSVQKLNSSEIGIPHLAATMHIFSQMRA